MKWLLSDMDDKNPQGEYVDTLSQIPFSSRKHHGGGVNSGPPSERLSFSHQPLSDR